MSWIEGLKPPHFNVAAYPHSSSKESARWSKTN